MLAQSPAFAAAVDDCFATLPKDAPADLYAMMLEAHAGRCRGARPNWASRAMPSRRCSFWNMPMRNIGKAGASSPMRSSRIAWANMRGLYGGGDGATDALRIVTLRGQVMDAAPAGAMTTVPQCAPAVGKLIGDALDIAAINMAEATVVSGPLAEIAALEARLAGTDHEARRIHIDVAAHSRQLDGQLETFRAGFDGVRFGKLTVPMVSSLRGDWATGDDITSADYWVRHLRHTVRFTDAIAATFATEKAIRN